MGDRPACIHLGRPTGKRIPCASCNKKADGKRKVSLKLHKCAVRGICTLGPQSIKGVPCCAGCNKYTVAESWLAGGPAPGGIVNPIPPLTHPLTINLAYFIYPVRGGIWRWNAHMLRQRLGLFNGRKIVYIAYGPETDPPGCVKYELGGDIEYIEAPNNPHMREVAGFIPMLERLCSLDPSEVTVYGHAKGVTRQGHPTIPAWTAMLYCALFDHWPLAVEQLESHPIAGSFKKHGRGWEPHESRCDWHYSGSFFALRHDQTFNHNWRRMDRFWSGVETWPGNVFTDSEGGVVFHEDICRNDRQLYQASYLSNVVMPAWQKWQEKNVQHLATHPVAGMTPEQDTRWRQLAPWHTSWSFAPPDCTGWWVDDRKRVRQFLAWMGKDPGRVLELSCLEGSHTVQLSRRCQSVLSLEGRQANVDRARLIMEIHGIRNVEVRQVNLDTEDSILFGKVDAVFCVGLLYHLTAPQRLLQQCAMVSDRLFLWTHISDTEEVPGGKWHEEGNSPTCGLSARSFWPTKQTLLGWLRDLGYSVQVIHDDPRHASGHAITLACLKGGA